MAFACQLMWVTVISMHSTLLALRRKWARWVPEGHWKAMTEILGFKEPAKVGSSKSLPFRKDPTQNTLCGSWRRLKKIQSGGFCAAWQKDSLGHTGRQDWNFLISMCCCYFRVFPPANWDGTNSHIMGSALFSHPHRRNSHVNVFSGNNLKKTGTTPMPPPCTNTRTRKDNITWPWIKTAHPGRDTGLNDTRNSLTFYPGQ